MSSTNTDFQIKLRGWFPCFTSQVNTFEKEKVNTIWASIYWI